MRVKALLGVTLSHSHVGVALLVSVAALSFFSGPVFPVVVALVSQCPLSCLHFIFSCLSCARFCAAAPFKGVYPHVVHAERLQGLKRKTRALGALKPLGLSGARHHCQFL